MPPWLIQPFINISTRSDQTGGRVASRILIIYEISRVWIAKVRKHYRRSAKIQNRLGAAALDARGSTGI
jgi:hypothetical protein